MEAHHFSALVAFHEPAHLSFVLGRADMTFPVIEARRQRVSRLIIRDDPVWVNLFQQPAFQITPGVVVGFVSIDSLLWHVCSTLCNHFP